MKKGIIGFLIWSLWVGLLAGCSPAVQTVETTRIVPQTIEVTRITTQLIPLLITTTPIPTGTPTPWWTPSIPQTPAVRLTLTPGLQVAEETTRINVEQFVSAEYIKEFLNISYSCTPFGGKMFSAYYPLGVENDGQTIKLYLWVIVEEYYLDHQDLKSGCGMATPVVLFVETRDVYRIVGYQDGGLAYGKNKINFPLAIQKLIDPGDDVAAFNHRSDLLQQETNEEAKAYFGS